MAVKRDHLRLFWTFWKSTLAVNLLVSFIVSLFAGLWSDMMASIKIFPLCFMTAGPLLSFFYKEIARPNEYYFYNNRGISKYQLMAFTMAVCILTGIFTLILLSYVASS